MVQAVRDWALCSFYTIILIMVLNIIDTFRKDTKNKYYIQ